MLQYLLNTTAIWLISLVMYDLFLRRESYHGYNRFYLLFTLLLGALLPLWQWQEDSPVYTGTLGKPIRQVMDLKQTIAAATGPSTAKINWELYLGYAYLLGVMLSLVLLIAEVIRIVRLYYAGKRSRDGSYIIIETGRNYSPFSLFNLVFVSGRDRYSAEEWDMLIAHEQMHGLLFHFIDVLLVQVARIVFWFHPLVYVYQKKLMMLHEYQADKVSSANQQFYGRFLVEQALLQAAPSITHSFNRSPIKNRILMLTHRSTTASKSKMLLFIPLALICLVFFSKNSFSQKFVKNGNIITYRGNTFELSKPKYDTMITINPVNGKESTIVTSTDQIPVKMNEKTVYNDNDIISDPFPQLNKKANLRPGLDGNSLREYLLSSLSEEFKSLGDMQYLLNIKNIVVDEQGKIVYFENGGISVYNNRFGNGDAKPIKIDQSVQDKITGKINKLLNEAPAHTSAALSGDPVPFLINTVSFWNPFTIKDHKITAE